MQMGHIGPMTPKSFALVGRRSKSDHGRSVCVPDAHAESAHIFRIPLAETEDLAVELPIASDLADGSAETTCQIEAARQRAVISIYVWGLATQ